MKFDLEKIQYDLLDNEGLEKFCGLENSDEASKSILSPFLYLSDGNKKHSGILAPLAKLYDVDDETIEKLRIVLRLVKNSVLMVDDIEDGSLKRKGKPCSHIVFGIPSTINCANYLYFVGFRVLLQTCPKESIFEVMDYILAILLRGHEGQQMDIYFRSNSIIPTEEEYLEMIDKKTGSIFYFVNFLFRKLNDSPEDKDLENLLKLIARYYQINDDYINLKLDDYSKMKGFAEDISEGKFSFPIIHACRKFPKDRTIINILRLHTQEPDIKMVVIEKLQKAGSFEYTLEYLKKLSNEIQSRLGKLAGDKRKAISDLISHSSQNIVQF